MRSVSVVPAGLTKFREGLYPLEMYTKEEAGQIIDLIESYQQGFFEVYGLHFIHASDEWYITAGRDFPEEERYDGYIQLENGVGMMRLFMEEFEEAFRELEKEDANRNRMIEPRTLSIATGKLAYSTVQSFADRMMRRFPEITIQVFPIRNDFFGETITVSGLITGRDLTGQLIEKREEGINLGTNLLIPINMLRSGEQVFLDDVTVEEAENLLGLHIVPVEASGRDFIEAILNPEYYTDRVNDRLGYVEGYPRDTGND